MINLHTLSTTFAQVTYSFNTSTTSSSGKLSGSTVLIICLAAIIVGIFLGIIPLWKIFKKFGKPGWAAIIPIYSTWVAFEIVGYPGWWAILSLIPIVSIFPTIMAFISYFKIAKLLGKGTGFAICTIFFSFICLPILGYGKSQPINGATPQSPANGPLPPSPVQDVPADNAGLPPQPPVTPTESPQPPNVGGPVSG